MLDEISSWREGSSLLSSIGAVGRHARVAALSRPDHGPDPQFEIFNLDFDRSGPLRGVSIFWDHTGG